MKIRIVTEYWSNKNGSGRIRAREVGVRNPRKLSQSYDHALNRQENHEEALAAFLRQIGLIDSHAIDDTEDNEDRGILWTLVPVSTVPYTLTFSH